MIRRPIFGVENNSTRTVVRQVIAEELPKNSPTNRSLGTYDLC
jgi:hypothetical protein